jgi:hypothetical protein
MPLQSFVEPWPLFQFPKTYTQSVGLLGRGISPSQGRYPHTEQHKQNKRTHIQALSGILTHDPCVLASEDSSCLRPRGHCDRLSCTHIMRKYCDDDNIDFEILKNLRVFSNPEYDKYSVCENMLPRCENWPQDFEEFVFSVPLSAKRWWSKCWQYVCV